MGLPACVAAGERWGVACEPALAPPPPLRFPGCEGLLMCPPDPALGGSNPAQATKVPLPASMGDLAAIRRPALGGLPSAQREHRAYLWLNETDSWRPHGCLEAGQAPVPRKVHIRPRAQLALAWALVATQTCVGGGGLKWGPSALPVVGCAGLTEQGAFAPCLHLCSALLGGPQTHGWTLPCGPITTV